MNQGLQWGGTVVTLPRFDLEDFLRTIQDHKITRAFVAPPILLALAKHPLVDQYDLSVAARRSLSGAAPLDEALAQAAEQRLRTSGADDGVTVAPGLRHDRAVPGLAHHPRPGPGARRAPPADVPEGLGRLRDPEHRVPAGRPGHRRGRRRGRARRAVGPRPAGDEGLPEQPRGHRGHRRRRGLAAHR